MKYWSDHEQCFIFDRRAAYFKSDFLEFNSKGQNGRTLNFLLVIKMDDLVPYNLSFSFLCESRKANFLLLSNRTQNSANRGQFHDNTLCPKIRNATSPKIPIF